MHDALVFGNSPIYKKETDGKLVPTRKVCDKSMPIVLLGNSVYSLLPSLIKPFPHTTLSVTGFCLFEGAFDSSFFLLILALLEATLGTDLSYHLVHEYYHHYLSLSLMTF